MLEVLKIKNIAIIDLAEIPFKQGLNILSGETGAGKSIIIEAIGLLLGSRASSELIRSGCDEAVVEGLFDLEEKNLRAKIDARLDAAGLETGSRELIIKRVVNRSGKHRIHINGEATNLSSLQAVCEGLIDLCSQHEHQSLTKPQIQLDLLDRFGGLSEKADALTASLGDYRLLKQELTEIEASEAERSRRADFLKFQIEELKAAELEVGEDEKLSTEKHLLQSAGTRVSAAENVRATLEDDEEGAITRLQGALNRLKQLNQLDERIAPTRDALERGLAELEEVSLSLNRYLSSADVNPERLEEVQERLSELADLRRKYGAGIPQMLETLDALEQEFSTLDQAEGRAKEIGARIATLESELGKSGKKLSAARKKVGEMLAISVTRELNELKMGEARFAPELTSADSVAQWSASGPDTVQFLIQTNAGEAMRPLGKIASGGELSRLMLAIRRVISDRGGIGVYLFDEIDAGMGGQTAFQVGKKLKSVASHNQVICITHLPQVASFADHHLVVRKSTQGKRTLTEVAELGKKERREELARMLGGPQLTRKSLENAAELLELAR
jgi:DNA repair protein RecN (Recombination protein N)